MNPCAVVCAVLLLCVLALVVNKRWVDLQTRAAEPRDGGTIVDTEVGARIVMIDGAGHSPMIEAPAKTLEALRRFLSPAP